VLSIGAVRAVIALGALGSTAADTLSG